MTSSGREALKWIAVLLMTGDHVAKVLCSGYIPGVSEAGRVAFPLFALVMAYNLSQPGADVAKSVRRLALWGSIAQPVHALAFGYWIPVNILLTFALSAAAIYAASERRWVVLAFAAAVLPAFVDYQWAGVGFVLLTWLWFRGGSHLSGLLAFIGLCAFNGNLWAFLAVPVAMWLGSADVPVRRTRWAFYGYYVAHLALLVAVASIVA